MHSAIRFARKISSALAVISLMTACNSNPPAQTITTPPPSKPPIKVKVGLALGGGAAKGFAHIGVIKMLEANGIKVDVVSGTSAGSVVGAMYASGMDAFALQERAFSLDESQIRDVNLIGGGLVKGQKLQDYVNQLVGNKTIQQFPKPFSAVATELETGNRVAFNRGNVGQAVRASSSIPGIFMPVQIGNKKFVDGGVVSPVPVDAARELGANFVIAVDISSKATGTAATSTLGVMNQAIVIMGQKLGEQELARADIVIRPKVGKIGAADFDMKNIAILEGEKAALAMLPLIRQKMADKANPDK
ncbi:MULTISPECIES: patatin-like phospholipase family protein [Deefgea]|uniref:Patatin-like phospholipase family protein n=1 Tax=Deefgea chitinilytica TaxID=570276 RepID=A0ABS2CB42_9NEIS|nr:MULTISPECIES: patatin-like phospholipase family protein [Deefgea]MBM5570591.1 patatin-like phospholipase family protein [Deefgea chitinilytica]MBM9887820.1 patatin-like phospholipase family protein [Deefgea sp. CFH1-16]